jgi:DNA-binding Lrp family transcriptional regulator
MNAHTLFERYCELDDKDRRLFKKLVADHESFARSLEALATKVSKMSEADATRFLEQLKSKRKKTT